MCYAIHKKDKANISVLDESLMKLDFTERTQRERDVCNIQAFDAKAVKSC